MTVLAYAPPVVARCRYQPFPAQTPEDLRLLALLAEIGTGDTVTATATGTDGRVRAITVSRRLVVEAPGPDVAAVASEIALSPTLEDGEVLDVNLWTLAIEYLEACERTARERLEIG